MQYKFTLTFLLLITFGLKAVACDCKQQSDLAEAQELNYRDNDLIFIGRVTEISEDKLVKLEVVELLKGEEIKWVQIAYFDSCSLLPNELDEYWLIYMDKPKEGQSGHISSCGLSRSFKQPFPLHINDVKPPRPPAPNTTYSPLEEELLLAKYRLQYLEILKAEIEKMSAWKEEN